jgi:hypothetical protein
MSLVVAPLCIYFAQYSALNEMLYATFGHNFHIALNSGNQSFFDYPLKFIVLYLPMAICFALWCSHIIKKRNIAFVDALLGSILLLNFVVFLFANRYPHYFAVFVPVYLAFLSRYFTFEKKKIITHLVVVCTVVNLLHVGYYTASGLYSCFISKSTETSFNGVQDAIQVIPESERNSIIGYQIPVSYYVLGDIIPCYKYYTWQESWAMTTPQILSDFMEWVRTDQPLWILTTPEEDHLKLLEILNENYYVAFENELLICYRLV